MLKNKIKSLSELKKIRNHLKTKGEKLVFTNGCFDLLHYGHVKYLEEAKAKGDCLLVAVNSDASVRKIKGKKRPIVAEDDRMGVIAGLESVDYVLKFAEEDPLRIIKALKPDILVKGADWSRGRIIGADFIAKTGGKVVRVNLLQNRSTSNLIKRIAKLF